MSDYLCTGGQRPGNDNRCPQPRPERDDCEASRRPETGGQREECRDTCRREREDCACRRDLVQALQLLLRTGLSSLVDFQAFAFVTKQFLVGAPLVCTEAGTAAYDNLADELTAVFGGFTPCACDYIDVTGPVYLPNVECPGTGVTASRLNLCDITAVAFGVLGDTEAEAAENYQNARQLLRRFLQPGCCDGCPPFPDPCDEKFRCDCENKPMPGGATTLVAGDVLLANVTVLGKVGQVLVLANDADQRFYFVCSEKAVTVR